MDEPLETWFKREILLHEEALMRFLGRVWPRHNELADIRQEAYARVYEAALASRPQSGKAFLFATARHLMTDRVRRERIVSIKAAADTEFLHLLVDEVSPERRAESHQELSLLAYAFDRLPDKCRKVVWMRRVKGLSQKEVAQRLGLSEKAIEKRLANAGQLLVHYMRANSPGARPAHPGIYGHNDDESGNEHGQHGID